MKLFVGLGNPGSATRAIATTSASWRSIASPSGTGLGALEEALPWPRLATARSAAGACMLLKPQTYMNDSGQAVGEAQRYLKIAEDDIYVFHDEIDLAPAKLKVKAGGGNAGHNGLRSISAHIGNEYARVRIGVGHPGSKDLVSHYVLHDFAKADADWLEPLLDAMADAAGRLAAGDEARFLTDVARALQARQGSQTSDEHAERRQAGGE